LFCWYWWNCWPSQFKLSLGERWLFVTKQKKVYTVMVNNSTNINKTKESLNSDGQQFYQYQQNKRKFKQWWWIVDHHSINCLLFCWYWWNSLPSLFKLSFVLLILVELLTISLYCDGQQFYQYQQNKRKFKQWWSTILPISTKQKKV
jgi:hypothetical protein